MIHGFYRKNNFNFFPIVKIKVYSGDDDHHHHDFDALVDTGSDISYLDKKNSLKLVSTSMRTVKSITNDEKTLPLYNVRIILDARKISLPIICSDLSGKVYDALLGWDVLQYFDISMRMNKFLRIKSLK